MNIFCPYASPVESAEALDDLRLNKMIVEAAQLLSTAVHKLDPALHKRLDLYKPAYPHHPCTRAVQTFDGTFHWVYLWAEAMNNIRLRGTSKDHASWTVIRRLHSFDLTDHFEKHGTYFPNCTTVLHDGPDIHERYRLYLAEKWREDQRQGRKVRFSNRPTPSFYEAI